VTVTGSQQPSLTALLSSAETSYNQDGDIIHYSIEIRNTGNITLTNLEVKGSDPTMTGANTIADILPGGKAIVAAEHLVSQADVTATRLINRVTVTGNKPNGGKITGTSNEVTLLAGLVQGLSVTAVAQESAYSKSGEVIHYNITVSNRGNIPVSNIRVSDPNAVITGNPLISLPVSGSITVAAERIISQSDVDAGQVSSQATIAGKYPDGMDFNEMSNQVTIFANNEPGITARITAAETSFRAPGDQINYTIEVLNTGNLTVSNINLAGVGSLNINSSEAIRLTPGEKAVIPASYTITTADLDAGLVVRSVNATGKDPHSQPLRATGNEARVVGVQIPELTTTAAALVANYSQVGELIHYNIAVKNSGNVSLISTAVTDPNAVIITVRPITLLLPGETVMVSASHLVTQADIDSGKVITTATAAGFDQNGNTIEKKANTITVPALQRHELTVVNTPSRSIFNHVGDIIQYNVMVRNSGNVSLSTIAVTDPALLLGTSDPIASLLPGEAMSVAASHTVTQEDMDAGEVVSKAKASGRDLYGKAVENTGNRVTVIGDQRPELTATTATSVPSYKNEGDVILYTVVVKNTGNVTMTDIYMTDAKVLLDFSRPFATLAPGETDSVTAEHRVTNADIRAGKIVTAAIANGTILSSQKYSYLSNDVTVRLLIENYNLSNFPNPFTYETTITFDLPEKGEVILKIYDMTGKEVGDLVKEEFNEGRNFIHWKTTDTQKGIYILKMYYKGDLAVKRVSIVN